MKSRLGNIKIALVTTVYCMVLTACVTTTENSVFTKQATEETALRSHVEAAYTYLRKNDHENARRHLRKAEEINSKDASLYNALAYSYELSQDFELAGESYQKAIRLDPALTSARNNYGVFLFKQGDYKGARNQFSKVVEDTLYERRGSAFNSLGLTEVELGNLDAGKKAFERALIFDRTNRSSMLELANIGIQQQDYVYARKQLETYRLVSQQTARSLLLGADVADHFNMQDELASIELALKNRFPESIEYQTFQQRYK